MKKNLAAQAVLALVFLSGCGGPLSTVKPGVTIQADFTCRLADGSLVDTTFAKIAGDPAIKKSTLFEMRNTYIPLRFTLLDKQESRKGGPFDPLEQKIGAAIADHGDELSFAHPTHLILENRQVENMPTSERYVKMVMEFTIPRTTIIPIEVFEKHYATTPVVGLQTNKESDLPGIVRAIKDGTVTLYFSPRNAAKLSLPWGGIGLVEGMDQDNITIKMDVHTGQLFPQVGGVPGRVTAIDKESYTIDYGQSFAGENLSCEVTAKPDEQKAGTAIPELSWSEDLDKGLNLARQQGKPVVLFLYADQGSACQIMLHEIFENPSLDSLRDSFVWVKIDSEKRTEYAKRFGQESFPMTVVLNSDGSELEKLTGLQKVATLASKLDTVLSSRKKAEQAQ